MDVRKIIYSVALLALLTACSKPKAFVHEMDNETTIGSKLLLIKGDECLLRASYTQGYLGYSPVPRSQWDFYERNSPFFELKNEFFECKGVMKEIDHGSWGNYLKGFYVEYNDGCNDDTIVYNPEIEEYYVTIRFSDGTSERQVFRRDSDYDEAKFD